MRDHSAFTRGGTKKTHGRSLSGNGFLAGKKSIADVKALSPCGTYPNDRTGNPNAVVNARQKKVNIDYHFRAKSLNAREVTRAMVLKRSSASTARKAE